MFLVYACYIFEFVLKNTLIWCLICICWYHITMFAATCCGFNPATTVAMNCSCSSPNKNTLRCSPRKKVLKCARWRSFLGYYWGKTPPRINKFIAVRLGYLVCVWFEEECDPSSHSSLFYLVCVIQWVDLSSSLSL
jgi:hypothetical protein